MTKNYHEMAEQILDCIGGKENIAKTYHCMTRLRFHFKDKGIVKTDEIQKVNGVVGTQWAGDQLQIIIGQDVDHLYKEVCQIAGIQEQKSLDENLDDEKKKFKISDIFAAMAAIMLPVVPALAGGGMIKGMVTILTSYCGVDAASTLIQVMTMAGDCMFYFLPFLVAWSAAKYFKTNIPMAIALAGVLLYPTMTAGNTAGAEAMSLFGLPIPFPRYFGSTIPILLTVFALKYVYRAVDHVVPKVLRVVFTPMFTMLIMTPLALCALGPLASYISQLLVVVVKFLYDLSPAVAGAIVGGTRLFVVMSGMHLSLSTICIENLATFGYDYLLPMNTMGTLALFGACLAVWLRSKNQETKQIGASTAISAFIGITEPGIYGCFLKFKTVMIGCVAGGALGGAIVGMFGGQAVAYVNSCILSLPVFMGEGFWAVCLGMAVAAIGAFATVMLLGVKEVGSEESTAPKLEAELDQPALAK